MLAAGGTKEDDLVEEDLDGMDDDCDEDKEDAEEEEEDVLVAVLLLVRFLLLSLDKDTTTFGTCFFGRLTVTP